MTNKAAAAAAGEKPKKAKKKKQVVVVNVFQCQYPIVRQAVRHMGWKIAETGEAWDVGWSDTNGMVREIREMSHRSSLLSPVQRINHFPNNKQLVRKDLTADNINALARVAPQAFDFAPESWNLPSDLSDLVAWMQEDIEKNGPLSQRQPDKIPTYIIKPATGQQGIGIKITQDPHVLEMVMVKFDEYLEQQEKERELMREEAREEQGKPIIPPHKRMVVQKYIESPFLLDGFKFDIRLYVLVTSIKPLKVYLYDNGLARLCTTKYAPPDPSNMKKCRQHLTNFAINKASKNFIGGDQGTKRSIKSVLATIAEQGHDPALAWSNIADVVVKTMIGFAPLISSAYDELMPPRHILKNPVSTCFEVFGFDVMLDSNLKVWLVEINHMPSFSGGSPLDQEVKFGVVSGAMEKIKVSLKRKTSMVAKLRRKRQEEMVAHASLKAHLMNTTRAGAAPAPAPALSSSSAHSDSSLQSMLSPKAAPASSPYAPNPQQPNRVVRLPSKVAAASQMIHPPQSQSADKPNPWGGRAAVRLPSTNGQRGIFPKIVSEAAEAMRASADDVIRRSTSGRVHTQAKDRRSQGRSGSGRFAGPSVHSSTGSLHEGDLSRPTSGTHHSDDREGHPYERESVSSSGFCSEESEDEDEAAAPQPALSSTAGATARRGTKELDLEMEADNTEIAKQHDEVIRAMGNLGRPAARPAASGGDSGASTPAPATPEEQDPEPLTEKQRLQQEKLLEEKLRAWKVRRLLPLPREGEEDKYVLVYSEVHPGHREMYADVRRAANMAMKDKLNNHDRQSSGRTTWRTKNSASGHGGG